MRTLDDTTQLNSAEIDVAARIGWIIRMARTTLRGVGDTRLQAMAARVGSSPAHLSRVETGQRRDGALVHRYEESLQLPTGALWAPTAVLCRTFPLLSPRDTGAVAITTDVRSFSRLTSHLDDLTTTPANGDWLEWARALELPGNISMPAPTFTTITRRLIRELSTATGHDHPVRFEAMAMLRGSAYGDLVLDLAREAFESPFSTPQLLNDLAWLIGQSVTPEAIKWALGLLEHEETAAHGAITLEAMGHSEFGFWEDLALPLLAVFDHSAPGSRVEEWTTHLIRLVPREIWAGSGHVPSRPLPSHGVITDWTRAVSNPLWEWCVTEADAATAAVDAASQPVLARILFEITFGPWETRAATAAMLLGTTPGVAASVPASLARYAEQNPQSPLLPRVLRRLTMLLRGAPLPGFEHWATSDDDALRTAAAEISRRTVSA